jgi:pilus assembly protein CpaE
MTSLYESANAADAERPIEETTVAEAPLGKLVTVFSAKGGTGKTVVSTNLAIALARKAIRGVCLLDLDLEFGDVAIAMNMAPLRGIVDALDVDVDEPGAISALVMPYGDGLDCVLAPVNPSDSERISADLVRKVIARLRCEYDYIVVDSPPQLSEQVLEAFDAADHHVLVTTPEIPSLKNLRLTLDMLDLLGYGRSRRTVVLNRADPKVGLGVAEAEAAIDTPITAQLPATQDATSSVNKGVPLAASNPKHPFSTAIAAFAERFIDQPVTAGRRRRLGLKLRKRSS